MRLQNKIKNVAAILFIVCAIILGISIIKTLKININFLKMQSPERISSSSKKEKINYEPTDYTIVNKDEVLEEVKKITLEFKNEHINSGSTEGLFEIANINKIEKYFYGYDKYAVVKYKLLNIVDNLPKLYKATKGKSNVELEKYFNNNTADIEYYYGITKYSDFEALVNSLGFLGGNNVKTALVQSLTIDFDYDNDVLGFQIGIISNSNMLKNYSVLVQYFLEDENQIAPYVCFKAINS